MAWGHVLRRVVHLATPVFLIYYMLPSPVWEGGPEKETGLLIFMVSVLFFELLRRIFGFKVQGLRDYERWRMAAYAWAAMGLTIVFLTMPFEIAVPAVIGMAWVDPLIGELRMHRDDLYPAVPIAVYFTIVLLSLTMLTGFSIWVLGVSVLVAPIAIWVERQRFWRLDDDMTMMVIPAFIMWAVLSAAGVI